MKVNIPTSDILASLEAINAKFMAIRSRYFKERSRIFKEIREAALQLDINRIEELQAELEREYQLAIESAEMFRATIGKEY